MKKLVVMTILSLVALTAYCQDTLTSSSKHSYLSFGQPAIEDNSMLIEEAFNQESGVIQHISNFIFDEGAFVYSYTQELPLAGDRHQLSFTIPFSRLPRPEQTSAAFNNQHIRSGLGDVLINYRPMLADKNDWALVIPRFTLIIPTGNAQYGLGSGGLGAQFNLAVTKRFTRTLVSHWNAGTTYFGHSKYYALDNEGQPQLLYSRDLTMMNIGSSLIWFIKPKFNLMLELLKNFDSEINAQGDVAKINASIINPGFRFALDIGKVQIVPGLGVPMTFSNGTLTSTGTFFYLSIEPAY